MMYALDDILLCCLRRSLHVLVVSSDQRVLAPLDSLSRRFPVMDLSVARTEEQVASMMAGGKGAHGLILDSRCPLAKTALGLLDQTGRWVPVTVLVDSSARMTSSLSAEDMWDEIGGDLPLPDAHGFDQVQTIRADDIRGMFRAVIRSSIQARLTSRVPGADVRRAFALLFENNPVSIEDWAMMMKMSPRALQRRFENNGMSNPKKIISLYHAYRIGFEKLDAGHGFFRSEPTLAYSIDNHARSRVMEYVLSRKASILGPSAGITVLPR